MNEPSTSNDEKPVKLNIGGSLFHTTRSTLTKIDGFFKTIMETRHMVTKDASGAIVINRDPKHFNIILSYMIDGYVDLLKNEKELCEILEEADYYMLNGLVDLCENEIEEREHFKNLKFISNDDHLFRTLARANKPLIVIHYRPRSCRLNRDIEQFDCTSFVKKHSNKFDVYFKVQPDFRQDASFGIYLKCKGPHPVLTGPLVYLNCEIARFCRVYIENKEDRHYFCDSDVEDSD